MMSLWDALRMNMMISYQELVRTFLRCEERPNGEWRVYDIDRKINISTMNKDTAFDEWKAEAKKQHNS
ncbi:hypothetical protein BvCmsKSP023_01288 [Escherichia coli]|nr:hypothetical protein BvCmsKSP023_01288 [Escherichia coli]